MPFGISSALEVFQHKVHKLIEELTGIEVMVEAFFTVGYGERYKVLYDHDWNLLMFL